MPADSTASQSTRRRVPVVLDCDPGHDDALALVLAAGHPDVDLLGVTTVAGNGDVWQVTENVLRFATLAGLRTDLPVAIGAGRPLAGVAGPAVAVHGVSALDGATLPAARLGTRPVGAVEQLLALLSTSDGPVTIVATGPLTNVATLLADHPAAHASIAGISLMGGSAGRGNWTPAAEFNVWADPEAADVVLHSGLPVRMTGLDVTHTALVTPEVLDRLRAQDTELACTCADLLGFFATAYRDTFGMPAPPLHDPLAVLAAVHPDWMTWQECNVEVETAGRHTRGATVVDLDGVTGRPANAHVARSVDVDRFFDLLLDCVARLGRRPEPAAAPAPRARTPRAAATRPATPRRRAPRGRSTTAAAVDPVAQADPVTPVDPDAQPPAAARG